VVRWKHFLCAWGRTAFVSPSRGDDAALGTRGTAAMEPLNEETFASQEGVLRNELQKKVMSGHAVNTSGQEHDT
jgi:hypothetical protein